MSVKACSTLAAMVLCDATKPSIDDLADEILNSKFAQKALVRAMTWDCDDLVYLDFDTLRIALHDVVAEHDCPNVICVGVGPVPGKDVDPRLDCVRLAHHLVKRLMDVMETKVVLWHEDERALRSAVMDDFQDELDKMLAFLQIQLEEISQPKQDTPKAASPVETFIPETEPEDVKIDDLRQALRSNIAARKPLTRPMVASLYVMACTFFFLVPAIGSTLLSYIWLRDGVDKKHKPT